MSEETTLGFSGFLSLIIQMAFYRANPRHGIFAPPPKEGKEDKKTSEPVPVSQCLKTFFSDMLPKLQKAKQGQFESVLRADSEVRGAALTPPRHADLLSCVRESTLHPKTL